MQKNNVHCFFNNVVALILILYVKLALIFYYSSYFLFHFKWADIDMFQNFGEFYETCKMDMAQYILVFSHSSESFFYISTGINANL